VPELALDDDQRHALASHLDGVGVAELVRRKAAPHSCRSCGAPQVGAGRGARPVPTARRAVDDAEQRADRELAPHIEPGLEFIPAPRVHADLAAAPALTAPDQERAAALIEICFRERERLLDAQPGSPQDDDQTAKSPAVRAVAGLAHHRDDLLHLGRIGRIPQAPVARRTAGVESGHRRRRATSAGAIEQRLRHDPSSGSKTSPRLPRRSNDLG
jgi:hypothetical protein